MRYIRVEIDEYEEEFGGTGERYMIESKVRTYLKVAVPLATGADKFLVEQVQRALAYRIAQPIAREGASE